MLYTGTMIDTILIPTQYVFDRPLQLAHKQIVLIYIAAVCCQFLLFLLAALFRCCRNNSPERCAQLAFVINLLFCVCCRKNCKKSIQRFDFFRRLLAGYLGKLCEEGEYDLPAACQMARAICYDNIKEALKL